MTATSAHSRPLVRTSTDRRNLDFVLHSFPDVERGGSHPWRVRDALEGTQIFGATGSGKTSGSGATLATAMLAAGFGGLVLTAKPSDFADWADPQRGLMARAGRKDRPVVLGPQTASRRDEYRRWGCEVAEHGFDFLKFEYRRLVARGINPTLNLAALFLSGLEGGSGKSESVSREPYWDDAVRQMISKAIDLCSMSNGSVDLATIHAIILSAPKTRSESYSRTWQQSQDSTCWTCLVRAEQRVRAGELAPLHDLEDYRRTAHYWLDDFAGLADRTRGIVISSFTAKADSLLRSPMRQVFCPQVLNGSTPAASKRVIGSPADCHAGRVVILDFPVNTFGETGRFAQVLYKSAWQMATQDREDFEVHQPTGAMKKDGVPVFLWADEAQFFVTSGDAIFQQTARSKGVATVYLTQNISNYHAALGSSSSEHAADSLLGNFQTKIFHANGDPVTNEWCERLFGTVPKGRPSSGMNIGAHASYSSQVSEQLEPAIPAHSLLQLSCDQPGTTVRAVVSMTSRRFDLASDVSHVLRTEFTKA